MRHLSLFSGIGGFDLASQWMGWKNVAHCEWNPFCQKILKYYWPEAVSYEDITKTDFSIWRGRVDIVTGGFPCQPYSVAGQRKGTEDERHLWPHMLRAIREIKPRWVVGENVRGLVSWNDGLVFEEVQADLEAEGYEVQPYILPACGTDAPHRRERVWFIAYSKSEGSRRLLVREKTKSAVNEILSSNGTSTYSNRDDARRFRYGETRQEKIKGKSKQKEREWFWSIFERISRKRAFANPNSSMRERRKSRLQTKDWSKPLEKQSWRHSEFFRGNFEEFPSQSPLCPGDDGISSRLDGITFPKWRNESIKGGGNAIVPQVALNIFKAITEYETLTKQI